VSSPGVFAEARQGHFEAGMVTLKAENMVFLGEFV
jgi:hypothetical protein